jgi:tetratricopeptide (TPR) repeat protein
MNDWAILILIYAVVFISSPLIVILHEMGHALAYLVLTRPDKIDIYIGSYGDAKKDIQLSIGKLRFFIKSSFPFVKGVGLCRSYKAETNYLKHIVILLAGPFFTFFSAAIFIFIMLFAHAGLYILISCAIFLALSTLSLITNLIPADINDSPFNLADKGRGLENDGKQILFNLKIRGLRPDYIDALDFIENDDFVPAIEKLKTILAALPNSKKLLRLMVGASIDAKQYDITEKYLTRLQDKFELSAHDLLQKGCYESFTNKPDEAIESYSKVLKADKNNIVALNNIGSELIEKGAHQVAKRALERAIKINPAFDYPYANLGYSKILQDELEEGKTLVDKCLELNAGNADAYKALGVYHLKLKDLNQARTNFKKALELDPELDLSAYKEAFKLLAEEEAPTIKQ